MHVAASRSIRWGLEWQKIEWLIGAVITIAAVYLHWVNLRSAGALWRDEAGIARIAILPSLREMWSNLGHESCPILFPVLLRGWSFIVGSSDAALRVFGFIIGLLLLSAVWLSGWLFHRSVPIIALGLTALNPSIVRWGDSVRAYGLGSMLMLLTLLTVWRFVRAPDCRCWLAAAVAGVMSVQCLFQNSFLLLAACSAAAGVAALRRDYRNAVASLAIGVPAAISLLPYFGIIREAQDWSVLSQIGFLPGLIWKNLSDMMAPTISPLRWLWIGLAAFAIAACVNSGRVLSHRTEADAITRALFAGAALLAALIAFLSFFVAGENANSSLVFSCAGNIWWRLHRCRAHGLACAMPVLALDRSDCCDWMRSGRTSICRVSSIEYGRHSERPE